MSRYIIANLKQPVDREKFSKGYDLIPEWDGWQPLEFDPPGQRGYEVKKINGRLYYRPLKDES